MEHKSDVFLFENKLMRLKIEIDNDPVSPRTWDNLGTMVCWHRNYRLGDEEPKRDPNEYLEDLACGFDEKLRAKLDRIEARYNLSYGYWAAKGLSAERQWREDLDWELKGAIEAVLDKHVIMLPLYLYDHSGITMSTSSFSCRWDSGQVGFIYVSKETVRKEYGWSRFTKDRVERIEAYLKGEVETYDHYLTGEVYGYTLEKAEFPEGLEILALLEAKETLKYLNKLVDDEDLDWDVDDSCWGFYGSTTQETGILENLPKEIITLAGLAA